VDAARIPIAAAVAADVVFARRKRYWQRTFGRVEFAAEIGRTRTGLESNSLEGSTWT
jgi:hypothetical protein